MAAVGLAEVIYTNNIRHFILRFCRYFGIIYNRVNDLKVTKETIDCKRVIYSDYKKFISSVCDLPQVEKEFFVEKLKSNYAKCAKKYAIFASMLDFEVAKQYKVVGRSIKTALKSIERKNKFLELVK
jgi:hypothetical protein